LWFGHAQVEEKLAVEQGTFQTTVSASSQDGAVDGSPHLDGGCGAADGQEAMISCEGRMQDAAASTLESKSSGRGPPAISDDHSEL
jgi:hypothetical protein